MGTSVVCPNSKVAVKAGNLRGGAGQPLIFKWSINQTTDPNFLPAESSDEQWPGQNEIMATIQGSGSEITFNADKVRFLNI